MSPGHATYGELIDICCDLTGNVTTPVWVDPAWLAAQDVRQSTQIPLWRTRPGTWQLSAARAIGAGLACRPLRDTLFAFHSTRPIAYPRQADHGLTAEREAAPSPRLAPPPARLKHLADRGESYVWRLRTRRSKIGESWNGCFSPSCCQPHERYAACAGTLSLRTSNSATGSRRGSRSASCSACPIP